MEKSKYAKVLNEAPSPAKPFITFTGQRDVLAQ